MHAGHAGRRGVSESGVGTEVVKVNYDGMSNRALYRTSAGPQLSWLAYPLGGVPNRGFIDSPWIACGKIVVGGDRGVRSRGVHMALTTIDRNPCLSRFASWPAPPSPSPPRNHHHPPSPTLAVSTAATTQTK